MGYRCTMHTPSRKSGKIRIFFDFFLHMNRLCDPEHRVAHCVACGDFILAPYQYRHFGWYYSLLISLAVNSVCAFIHYWIDQNVHIRSTFQLGYAVSLATGVCLTILSVRVIYALILTNCEWQVMDIAPTKEDLFFEAAKADANKNRSDYLTALTAFIFLYQLIRWLFRYYLYTYRIY